MLLQRIPADYLRQRQHFFTLNPHSLFEEQKVFDVIVGKGEKGTLGDCWDRLYVRVVEMMESIKQVRWCLDNIQPGPVLGDIPKVHTVVVPDATTTPDLGRTVLTGEQFFAYLRDSFDLLYREGREAPRMMSVGMHGRLLGRPGRMRALQRFLDHVERHDRVWVCRRIDIARHLGVSPEPLVLAIMFGANFCYVTPMAYQTNLLVMSAAGYRFSDFVRGGLPLLVLMLAAYAVLLPRFFPL